MNSVMLGVNEEPLIFFLMLAIAGVVLYTIKTFRDVRIARDREQTKRELAAYVAEGTVRPEDATAILNAGVAKPQSSEAEQQIASGVAWGTINPEKAARLIDALKRPGSGEPQGSPGSPR